VNTKLWANPIRLVVGIVGEAVNGAQWAAYEGWDGSGVVPALAVPVGDRRPYKVPDDGRFIRIVFVGSGDAVPNGFVESHVLEVEAYAADDYVARELLLDARRALHEAAGATHATDVGPRVLRRLDEPGKPTPLPTGNAGEERWRMAIEIELSTRG
jgi:hypothetical protein